MVKLSGLCVVWSSRYIGNSPKQWSPHARRQQHRETQSTSRVRLRRRTRFAGCNFSKAATPSELNHGRCTSLLWELPMVTIHDLTWDDERLLELFILLGHHDQGQLMKMASIAVCHEAAKRDRLLRGDPADKSPEADTLAALNRCRPQLPSGWASDTYFEFEVENTVVNRVGDRALDMILTTADHDERNAGVLADWAETHALSIANDYCAPSFEDGYVSIDDMRKYIEDWRDSFMSNLRRQLVKTGPQTSVARLPSGSASS